MDVPEGVLENITDASVALEESTNTEQQNLALHPVAAHVQERFERSKNQRLQDETRWLEAYRNYRGIYGPDVQFTDTEQSRIFVKVTKTKVMAAFAQICDVLFAGGKFPLGIEPTPVPEGVPESVHIEFEERAKPLNGSTALTTRPELAQFLPQSVQGLVEPDKVREGPGRTPTSATFDPAKEAAARMEKKIHDQLVESEADKHLRTMAFEMALFGTGIMKGPFSIHKEYPKWETDDSGTRYSPVIKNIPKITSVSIWNFYPDAVAHSMGECEYAIERHKLSAHQLRQLKKRPAFRSESINEAISYGPNYHPEYWENILEDNNITPSTERYEVLEYWGMIDKDSVLLEEIELGDEFDDVEEVQVNIWVCNGIVLRFVVNPYVPTIIPYYATPYEVNPYSFFGVGVAENMADTQLLMNGVMRMTVDNLALSGNLIFEVNETALVPGQDMSLHPGKMFRTQGAQNQGQAVKSVKFDNVTQELMAVYDKARQLTDESTNMPSYAHGGTGVQGMGRTASGMSMLMGAAAQSIKSIIRNIDDYFLAPCGRALFAFNMQYDPDPAIKGDLEVVARGTDSLMRNEIRSQRLLQFLQTGTGNPATAPLVKVDYILKELAASLELDPDRVVNNAAEMMVQADLIKKMSEAMGVNTNPSQGGGAPNPSDPTGNGGGNIAPGNAPEPGAAGFTGGGGGDNGGQQPQQGQMNGA